MMAKKREEGVVKREVGCCGLVPTLPAIKPTPEFF
jgi:hypothetical protein